MSLFGEPNEGSVLFVVFQRCSYSWKFIIKVYIVMMPKICLTKHRGRWCWYWGFLNIFKMDYQIYNLYNPPLTSFNNGQIYIKLWFFVWCVEHTYTWGQILDQWSALPECWQSMCNSSAAHVDTCYLYEAYFSLPRYISATHTFVFSPCIEPLALKFSAPSPLCHEFHHFTGCWISIFWFYWGLILWCSQLYFGLKTYQRGVYESYLLSRCFFLTCEWHDQLIW